MTSRPIPTPYDGTARAFQIGLKPLDPAEWFDVDADLPVYLAEKQRLVTAAQATTFLAQPGTEAAQAEFLALMAEHLPKRFPEIYRRHGENIEIIPTGRTIDLTDTAMPPLRLASRLVQDDLVLLRKQAEGWTFAAAALDFPTSWSLAEKFGKPMHHVHGPVPGFGEGTRNAGMIERMFDHLRPEMPVIRWNWSLFGDDRLHHPESGHPDRPRFGDGAVADSIFLRVERQTLRRLPQSGDIVFGIRIYVDPLAALERHPGADRIAGALIAQLQELSEEQRDYKGLAREHDRVVTRLEMIVKSA